MDVWSWICELPSSPEWTTPANSQLTYELARSGSIKGEPPRSIQLKAQRSSEMNTEVWITFSLYVQGFDLNESEKTIWVSDPCPAFSSDKPFLPLVLQLIQEMINRAPRTYHDHHSQDKSQMVKVKPDPIIWILQTHSPESFSDFFNIVLLTRLFWLCACDAPSDVGSLYFQSLLAPNLELLSQASHLPVMKAFMSSVGIDAELCIARAIGYMVAKWLIVREMRVGLASLVPLPANLGLSYANEACGLWVLKGYAPVWAMQRTCSNDEKSKGYPFVEAKESALRYSLAHQQLEAHIQLEYKVGFHDGYIQVNARVDNIRVHVAKLGYKNEGKSDVEFKEELYFPSRIGFWVGPEIGSNYVAGLSLGKSTINTEKEVESQKLVKGSFGKTKTPKVKTMSRTSTKIKMKNWRLDQDVEGNAAVFDAVLYENTNGIEVYSTKLHGGASPKGGSNGNNKLSDDLGKRYSRVNRPFMKSGGLVFTGNEYGEEVKWRLSKEMEGSVLKWRIGGKLWLTYWPSDVESSYYETRCIEWNHEVDLPLISGN